MDNRQLLLAALKERCQSLIKDGYTILYRADGIGWHYIKLHHSNGNYVSLHAMCECNRLVQRTNGIIVHDEKMR